MSYPKITDDDFNEEITRKFKRFTIPKKKKSFEEICFAKEYVLQPQQEFVAKYLNPNTPYKGLILNHLIGAGKTCSAISIAESFRGIRKIMVVLPASLISNFRDELRSQCADNNYLKQSERDKLKKLHPSSEEYKDIIKRSDDRIDRYYTIYSYNKFVELANEKAISLHNTILIIDEIQNMISETGLFYSTLYDIIHEAPESLRVVLLTATIMLNHPSELGLTMNLLRIPFEFPEGKDFDRLFISTRVDNNTGKVVKKAKNLDKLKEMIRGYISYYAGAQSDVFPEYKIKYVKCEMSDFQYRSYLTVLQSELEEHKTNRIRAFRSGDLHELPNNFFIGTRLVSNIAYPNKSIADVGYDSFKGKNLDMENLQIYSIKFYKIMLAIKRSPGPIFIFSQFKEYGGLKSLIKVLEHHGYVNYLQWGEGKRRYAVWSGDETLAQRQEIRAVFNQPSNSNGSRIRILLGSQAAKEGFSLYSVRQVHLIDPSWNISRQQQIIGRAIRFCSHKLLPEEDRNVKVYVYLATSENEEETVDQYIAKLAMRKDKLISEFETAIKEAAIDCTLFRNGNELAGDVGITCDP